MYIPFDVGNGVSAPTLPLVGVKLRVGFNVLTATSSGEDTGDNVFPTKSKSKEFCVGRGVSEPAADRVGRGVNTLIISIECSGVTRDDGTGVLSVEDGIGVWIPDDVGDSVSMLFSTSLLSGRYSVGTTPRKIL
jgi:hypothetical protein